MGIRRRQHHFGAISFAARPAAQRRTTGSAMRVPALSFPHLISIAATPRAFRPDDALAFAKGAVCIETICALVAPAVVSAVVVALARAQAVRPT